MKLLYPPAKRTICDTLMTIGVFLCLLTNIDLVIGVWIEDRIDEWLEKE